MHFKNKYIHIVGCTLILLLGLLLRIHYIDWGHVKLELRFHYKLAGDEVGYHRSAQQLIEKGIYGFRPFASSKIPNAFTTPGYTIFLAICYKVFGYGFYPPIVAIQIFQVILDLLSGFFLYSIALRILKRSLLAFIPLLLYMVHPSFILLPGYLLSETLYNFVSILFMLSVIMIFSKNKRSTYLIAGVLFGIMILIRPAAAPFLLFLIVGLVLYGFRKRTKTYALLFLAGLILMMGPWWARNLITLHKPVILAQQAGNPLLWGSYPYNLHPNVNIGLDPAELKSMAVARIAAGFKTEPFLYLEWYTVGKSWILIKKPYLGFLDFSMYNLSRHVLNNLHVMVMMAGFAGLLGGIVTKRIDNPRLWIGLFALASFTMYLPFAPTSRYFVTVTPYYLLGVGYLIDTFIPVSPQPVIQKIDSEIEESSH